MTDSSSPEDADPASQQIAPAPVSKSPAHRRPKGTGTLYKRADGRWEGQLPAERDGTGRRPRLSVYGRSRTEAASLLADAIAARKAGKELPDKQTPLSVWLERWLAEAKGRVRITTWRNYEGTCRVLLVPRIGSVPIGRIGPGLIRGVLEDVATGHGARSASVAHAVLRTALESAVRAQVVPRNHAKDVKTPSVRRSTPEPWSIADGQKFLSSVRGTRDEALYTLAIRLGLRQGELLGLAWEDVNIDSSGDLTTLTRPCEITIRHTLIWLNGAPHLGPTKSEASHRRLRLSDSLIATLTRQRELQDAERAACEAAGQNYLDNGLVFAAPNGRPLRGDVLTHQFQRLSDQLGLRPVRFHDLRRLAAGLMIHSSRGNVAAAGLMLGHSRKSSLTADLYAYLPPEMAAGMVEGVERLLAEVGERLAGDETSDTSDQSDIGEVGSASSHNQSDRPSGEQMTMRFGGNHARKRAPAGVVSDNS